MNAEDVVRFVGRQPPNAPLFEAHLFLTCAAAQIDEIAEVARKSRFRNSSRKKVLDNGSHDLLFTRNGNDESELLSQLRGLADSLAATGVGVYRIRLERMIADEHRME